MNIRYVWYLVVFAAYGVNYTGQTNEENLNCIDGSVVYDFCNRRCKCSKGQIVNCCRVRKDFSSMTIPERKRYIQVILTASTDPRFSRTYNNIVYLHENFFYEGIHKRKQFLPWHRWYLSQFESFLRQIDCRVTIPYWDWSKVIDNPWRNTTNDVWADTDYAFGRDAVKGASNECVKSGPFAVGKWHVTESADNMCLRRKFDLSIEFPNLPSIMKIKKFKKFESAVRYDIHNALHNAICGHMCDEKSANDPIFMLHHTMIDKVWDDWQHLRKSSNNYFTRSSIDKPMLGTSLTTSQFLNNTRLPGGICVSYV